MKDPVFDHLFSKVDTSFPVPQPSSLYQNLIRSVLSQQLYPSRNHFVMGISAKAVSAIHGRFLDLFYNRYPEAGFLRYLKDQQLRSAGVTRQKAGYLRNIAETSNEEDWSKKDYR